MKILAYILAVFMFMACQPIVDESNTDDADSEEQNKNGEAEQTESSDGDDKVSTLILFYSYTGNTRQIVADLQSYIKADVVEVIPSEKGLKYDENNYAIGSDQIGKIKAAPSDPKSYPAIDSVKVDLSKYSIVIVATPLWWSQMSSNMQAFLFKYGKQMSGKNIGLLVSSYSSGISGVEADVSRLIPDGNFFSKSLWINNSNLTSRKTLIETWLKDVGITYSDANSQNSMCLTVNSHKLTIDLVNNSSTVALINILKKGSITYEAHDYGNFEKVGDIGYNLPQNDEQITTVSGDIILYQGNNICIYYDTNEWNFTRLGKIRNVTQEELKKILGSGNVSVTLSLNS